MDPNLVLFVYGAFPASIIMAALPRFLGGFTLAGWQVSSWFVWAALCVLASRAGTRAMLLANGVLPHPADWWMLSLTLLAASGFVVSTWPSRWWGGRYWIGSMVVVAVAGWVTVMTGGTEAWVSGMMSIP